MSTHPVVLEQPKRRTEIRTPPARAKVNLGAELHVNIVGKSVFYVFFGTFWSFLAIYTWRYPGLDWLTRAVYAAGWAGAFMVPVWVWRVTIFDHKYSNVEITDWHVPTRRTKQSVLVQKDKAKAGNKGMLRVDNADLEALAELVAQGITILNNEKLIGGKVIANANFAAPLKRALVDAGHAQNVGNGIVSMTAHGTAQLRANYPHAFEGQQQEQ